MEDKDKEAAPGQPSTPEGSGMSPPPPPPPKQKSGLFGKKGPRKLKPMKPEQAKRGKPPREKKAKPPRPKKRARPPKPPKGQKKPLFSFGKKKSAAPAQAPPAVAPPGVAPQAGAPTVPQPAAETLSAPTGGPAAGAPLPGATPEAAGAAPEKKGLFGSKGAKPPRARKEKKPREKKVRAPREKKVREPRQKKPKAPKGQKKPLFSFGKKKKAAEVAPAPGLPAEGMTPEMAVAAAEQEQAQKQKGRRGKKAPRQPRVKEPKPPKGARKAKKGGGLGGSKQSPVGLDLGSTSISAVRLRYQTGGSQLLQAAIDTLPEGLIQEGEVRDVEALSFSIKEFWKTHRIKSKKVALGLANQKVVVRTLEFPLLDEKELRSAIEFQAQDYIPIPVDEAVFDFHVLGRFTDEEGVEKQKVLVVAAQKDMVMDFINAVKNARLSIAGVDLQAFSLLRALAPTTFLETAGAVEATAIANIASDITNLVVDVAGEPQFTRIISFGGDDFTKAVQDLQGITFAEAEQLKAQAGLPEQSARAEEEPLPPAGPEPGMPEPGVPGYGTPEPGMPGYGAPEPGLPEPGAPAPGMPEEPTAIIPPGEAGPPEAMPPYPGESPTGAGEGPEWAEASSTEAETEAEVMANIQRTLEVTADTLVDEIRRSLDYYMSQEQSVPVGRLVISGGGALLRNLDAHLAQVLPFPVEVGNPMIRIAENKSELTDEELQALATRLTISIGLALEDEG